MSNTFLAPRKSLYEIETSNLQFSVEGVKLNTERTNASRSTPSTAT